MMVGPPPPIEIFGQERPPPSVLPPRKPILKPVRVIPHCALPIVLCQIEVSLLQIWLSTAFKRFVGLRRLMTTLRPVPLKNLSRQVKFLTLWGFGMSVSSAETRDEAALAALWMRVVQDSLPVVWASAGRRGRERGGDKEGAEGLHGRPPARSSAAALQARCSA